MGRRSTAWRAASRNFSGPSRMEPAQRVRQCGNLFGIMYRRITGDNPAECLCIFTGYPLHDGWPVGYDYDLESDLPGLYVAGEATSPITARTRLGASLMRGLSMVTSFFEHHRTATAHCFNLPNG